MSIEDPAKDHVNEVLNAIYGKLLDVLNELSDTEGAEVLTGVKNMAKLVTGPVQEISTAINKLQEVAELKAANDEKETEELEDNSVEFKTDISDKLNDVQTQNSNLLGSSEKISLQLSILDEIKTCLLSLIFTSQQLLDIWKDPKDDDTTKGASNDEDFNIAEKYKNEMTKLYAKSPFADKLLNMLLLIDTKNDELVFNLIEDKEKNDKKDDNHIEITTPDTKENKEDKRNKKMIPKLLENVKSGFVNIAKNSVLMLRFAAIAGLKALVIVALITAMVVALDILQAVIRNSIDGVVQSITDMKDKIVQTSLDVWDLLVAWLDKWVARPFAFLHEGFLELQVILAKIDKGIILGFSSLLRALPSWAGGNEEFADKLEQTAQSNLDAKTKELEDLRAYNKKYYRYDENGDRIKDDGTDTDSNEQINYNQQDLVSNNLLHPENNKDAGLLFNNNALSNTGALPDLSILRQEYLKLLAPLQQPTNATNNNTSINNVNQSSTIILMPLSTVNTARNKPMLQGY